MLRRSLWLCLVVAWLSPSLGCWGAKQEPIQKKDVNLRNRVPKTPGVPADQRKK